MTDSSENTRNYYRNQGAIQERERIIKLICEYMDGWESQEEHMEEVIALIKGEK